MRLPTEMYTHEVLLDGRVITVCTMRQQILHCIGMTDSCSNQHKPYVRHGKRFYRPWRNYFTTNGTDEGWETLCSEGYAAHGKVANSGITYWLTRAGLDWLGAQLNVTIY